MPAESQPIWTPSAKRIANANLSQFIKAVRLEYKIKVERYSDLYQWSIDTPEQFWPAIWDFTAIKASQRWDRVINDEAMPRTKWFEGARLNFSENLLRQCHGPRQHKAALIFHGEDKNRCELTYRELYSAVANLAAAMREQGVDSGDRIAGFIPNRPEAVVAMLAATSLGAIWSSCSPDFGVDGAIERFEQIKPKLLFCCDGYWFKGRQHDSLVRVAEISQHISSITQVIVIPYLNQQPNLVALPNAINYHQFVKTGCEEIDFVQLPFDHPLYILYSSGTTGKPKCIVHSAGGTLIQHLKELVLHTDLKADDSIFYFTTCGWMMWNWLVSSLATGATLILYDGSPFHPSPEILFDIAEKEGMTIFGASAKYFSALEKEGVKPSALYPLEKLRTILSTGSPLAPESYDYIYREINADLQLSSISGGTDIVSCFALGNPLLPVYRGELQCRGLGMKVEIFDESGKAVNNQKGELVCTAPAPPMPLFFWGDDGNRKYHAAYFERFENTWAHGDYAEITAHDGIIIYGRSDALLNPGGVRIGTAEIYRQVEKQPEIIESIAVGQHWDDDIRIILFVKLQKGCKLNDALITQLKTRIRQNTTPRHVPDKIIAVDDIPRTRSGKIVELAVRHIIHNEAVLNISAIANPEALNCFKGLPELQR
ncbi:MAG: acetoacetate--CoA ligase [Gammaproteobacteria bacterium]|nr:acetoacetate--CoA ligase [Gammaproteobacteria bacterium]